MGAARPRFLGLLSALLLCCLLAAAPSRAEGEGISVVGHGTGWVDVTVHETGDVPEDGIVIRTAGRFGGFLLVPDTTTRPVVGALWLPRVGADGENGRLVRLGEARVYAGRYRLYLVGETWTSVTIPVPGTGFRAFQAANRTWLGYRHVDFTAAADAPGAERRVPLALSARRGTLVAAVAKVVSGSAAGVDYTAACVAAPSDGCADRLVPTVSAPLVAARAEGVAVREPGRYDAVFNVTHGPGVPGEATVTGALLVLPFVS